MTVPINNLREHREWALRHNIFRPPEIISGCLIPEKRNVSHSENLAQTNKSTSACSLGTISPAKPTTTPSQFSFSQIDWTDDDDIEFLDQSPAVFSENTAKFAMPTVSASTNVQPQIIPEDEDPDQLELSSEISNFPEHVIPTSDNIEFQVSQAPLGSDFELPKPEIGSLFTEKIALLEQKVAKLMSLLQNNQIPCNTEEVDKKLGDVDTRIERFVNRAEEVIDLQDTSFHNVGLRAYIPEPSKPSYETNDPKSKSACSSQRYIYNDHDDDHNDDIIEIQEPSAIDNVLQPIETTNKSPYFQNPPLSQRDYGAKLVEHPKYPWSKEVSQILLTKFGLNGFRANQAEAIDATLSGKDVVVLMPTGGGKSLCYQLPALVTSGKSKGTTVVISPLISLMQDQVYHLKNRNIHAETISSQLNSMERSDVYRKLESGQLQLLYVSPEMSVSTYMKGALTKLYKSGNLARIVIDEAHCVSAWGHDFRPDYMKLNTLKFEFLLTPIMALTATANDRVLLDIVSCLRNNSLVLKQSFNRKNLFYEVRPKTTNVLNEIATICKGFRGQTGIVYCNSKSDCEDTASNLKRQGISAEFYHAGMPQTNRAQVQDKWQRGEFKVVCATVAFGMGIDKPDVRFVIHHSLPRTMEGYYQETGRAGRDGLRSHCYLFFNYKDASKMRWQIQNDKEISFEHKENIRSLFDRVVQYCANNTDCRRKQVLHYFNEEFNSVLCREQCDNCRNSRGKAIITKDMTEEAKVVVASVTQMGALKITLQQCIDFLFGRKNRKMKDSGLCEMPNFGMLKDTGLTQLERLVHDLCSRNILDEYSVVIRGRYPQAYLKLGPKHNLLLKGQMPILLSMTVDSDTGQKRSGSSTKAFSRSKRTKLSS